MWANDDAMGLLDRNPIALGHPVITPRHHAPSYVGRGIAALAADPAVHRYAGRVQSGAELARTYGVTDVDGTQPGCWRYLDEIQNAGRPATELGYR